MVGLKNGSKLKNGRRRAKNDQVEIEDELHKSIEDELHKSRSY